MEFIRAERTAADAYAEVRGRDWDAVIDVARQPGHVRGSVAALADASTYVFVSSGTIYADHSVVGQDESAAIRRPLTDDVMPSMDLYGEAKAACEQAVQAAFPDRHLVARVGLIGGPGDVFGRSGYWPWRFAHPAAPERAVLVPDEPDLPVQVIDVRDLAVWLVLACEDRIVGTFNATGEALPLPEHLAAAREAAQHDGPVVAVPGGWLLAQQVQPRAGPRSMPLWLPDPAWRGFNARSSAAARQYGLTTRPLVETLRDTLAWEQSRSSTPRPSGLTDDEERELLGRFRSGGAS
ncbi:hypothetical protein [Geodermatophilus sp. SYSU D00700]